MNQGVMKNKRAFKIDLGVVTAMIELHVTLIATGDVVTDRAREEQETQELLTISASRGVLGVQGSAKLACIEMLFADRLERADCRGRGFGAAGVTCELVVDRTNEVLRGVL